MSDDNMMVKQIHATHAPDGREFDVKPLFQLVEDILNRATPGVDPLISSAQTRIETSDDRANQASFIALLEALSFTIDRISCEIAYKSLGGSDAHATTLSIFNLLTSYSWDAKLVLTLSAFAVNYGEFWLLAQIYSSNQLAKSMAILKQVPTILEHSGQLKPRFDALNNLIRAMVAITRCIIEFKELPSMYISQDVPALATAMTHIPTAVYWTIRSVVACATQITTLTSMGHEYWISATNEAWELSTMAHKINSILDLLKKQLTLCYQYIDDKWNAETFQMLLNLFESIHIDNMKILRALISPKDEQPLLEGSTKRRVNIDVLRRKNVLLLISGLSISHDELSILEQIYNESRVHGTRMESQYEVVWIPVVDRSVVWTDAMQDRHQVHQGGVALPEQAHPCGARSTRKSGRKLCGRKRLGGLSCWWMALTQLSKKENSFTCMEGLTWSGIRKFTTTAKAVASAARIPLEMVYVGKSNKREQVRKCITSITTENLSYCWQDLTMVWFFWTRLESMLFSKIQLGRGDDDDSMLREIKKLLSYDKEGGWAVLSKGSFVFVNGHSSTVLPTFTEYNLWKDDVPPKGFDIACMDFHSKLHSDSQPCCRFEFPSEVGRIPEKIRCPECLRIMEKYITFGCCHDENAISALY
ncbi:Protein SIEVE ELEMENT OCCLUSION B [Vitis vinifera]|uniref:Protein SIEVE ELEMENT OCCLUSION B n=1 Tax=Vitis vinifera TaxID=29760 RepID=A0A438H264_VITVI|nr:Protein SIEVE ELEMENT OCCLUSION B [Vitis vinifera]